MSPLRFSYVPLDATPSPEAEEVSVSTVAAMAVATGHLMLKVEGYSRLKARHGGESGSYIESCPSKVGGHTWKLRCYLNATGIKKDAGGFVTLYLILCTDPDAAAAVVLAECEFALVRHLQDTPPAPAPADSRHQGSKPSTTSHGLRLETRVYGGKGGSFTWGLPRFIAVEALERSSFLRDDCFAVRCTVTVVEERTVKEKAVQPHDLARLGMLCKCDDDLCKRHHDRPAAAAAAETFLERFAKLCHYICRGPV